MLKKHIYLILFFILLGFFGNGQDMAYNDPSETSYQKAHNLAYEGNHRSAKEMLIKVLSGNPDNLEARSLLARIYSWGGHYAKARDEFNSITSKHQNNQEAWVSAIKNELYSKNDATALGLANKALSFVKNDTVIKRLKTIAEERINNKKYSEKGWFNQETVISTANDSKPKQNTKAAENQSEDKPTVVDREPKGPAYKETLNNRLAIRNAFTVFDQRYDPMIYSSVSFRRQTLAGSIIPRINYSNRLGKNGIQYDLDFYPKFSKRFYAYLNYGYSSASIYPKHKLGGDLYVNLPGAVEFSAGGRYISFETRNVAVVTNSLGHYRGNYYFSLRSYITPQPGNLTRVSGNLLVRKYLKDAENYFGVNVGMGYSPELRQLISEDELLAETLLYVESQRLSLEYQFTGKKNPNAYRANVSAMRQELAFAPGKFFYGISAGLTYQVKF